MSANENYQFPTTQWTGVARASQRDTVGNIALGELLARYLSPMRAHLVFSRRVPPDAAEDLLQAFIADRVLEKDLLADADRDKGRFRTFLLLALNRFVSNAMRDSKRRCRSPHEDVAVEDSAAAIDPDPAPGDAFEIAWAREVLIQAAERMRHACERSGRVDLWHIFQTRILLPTIEGAEAAPYERLVAELEISSVEAAANLAITGKRMFARSLRGVVGEYSSADSEVDQEIADLRAILARRR